MCVYGTVRDVRVVIPGGFEQLIACEESAAPANERFEELELQLREVHRSAVAAHLRAREIDVHVAKSEKSRLAALSRAPACEAPP